MTRWSLRDVPEPRRRTISALEKVAWVALLLGLFGTFLGVGARSRTVVECGAVALLVAVAGWVAAAILTRVSRSISGVAVVLNTPQAPEQASGRCRLELSVSAPGIRPFATVVDEVGVPVQKWPYQGQSVPVLVWPSWPARVRVVWRAVPEHPDLVRDRYREVDYDLIDPAGPVDPPDPVDLADFVDLAVFLDPPDASVEQPDDDVPLDLQTPVEETRPVEETTRAPLRRPQPRPRRPD